MIAGDFSEAGGVTSALAELSDRRARQSAFGDTSEVFGGDRDCFLITAKPVEQANEHARGGLAVVHPGIAAKRIIAFGFVHHRFGGSDLGAEMGECGVDVAAEQRAEVDAVIGVNVLERRIAFVTMTRREPAAVFGQFPGERSVAGSVTNGETRTIAER